MIASLGRIRYLPPDHPTRLAVAITRPTLTSRPRLRVSVATTMPATITARVNGGPSEAPPLSATVGAGDATLEFDRDLHAGGYVVRVEARGADGQVATDTQDVFLGVLLPMRAARRLAVREMKREAEGLSERGRLGRCHRFGRRRVNCWIFIRGHGCTEVASLRLHPDGLAYIRRYDTRGDVRACRFRRHPGGRDKPALTV